MGSGDRIGVELEAHGFNPQAHAAFDLAEQVGTQARKKLAAEILGDVDEPAVVGGDVCMLGEVGVIAGWAPITRVELPAELALEECVEGVVDGGEAEARIDGADRLKQLLGGRVAAGGGEESVENLALAGGAQPVDSESVSNLFGRQLHRDPDLRVWRNHSERVRPECWRRRGWSDSGKWTQ